MTYEQPNQKITVIRKGLIDYKTCWDFQEQLFNEIVTEKLNNRSREIPQPTSNYLIFCEHPPVYTLGKSGSESNLLLGDEGLNTIGASFYHINRGGDITHHGPGQLVVYPVFDLENFFTDIHLYLRTLEEAVIRTLADFGIEAGRYPGYTGVWIEPDKPSARKICAMGVKCGRWVTLHGLALNVTNDLSFFNHIIACGIKDKDVTSMQQELPGTGIRLELEEVTEVLLEKLLETFEATVIATETRTT